MIIGTETWLTPDVLNNEIFPPELNYIVYRKDRSDGYGGVLIAVIQYLPSCEVSLQQFNHEILWVQLKTCDGHKYAVGGFYQPNLDLSQPLEELDKSLDMLEEKFKHATVWLAGDFNAPDIIWPDLTLSSNARNVSTQSYLLDITLDHGLYQMVNSPT